MRAVIGFDGSAGGGEAVELARSIEWPAGSALRVVTVIEPSAAMVGAPWAPGGFGLSSEIEARVHAYIEERLAEVVARLAGPGRTVEGVALRGRPASAVVDDAAGFDADLIIVGSRGHGQVASLVLGSVSAEIVDHASCPVLVARQPQVARVLYATDGSPAASHAESMIATWPIFAALPIHVVSVADVVQPWHTGIAPTMYRQVMEANARDLEEALAAHAQIAEECAARLRAAGRAATAEVRDGDTAAQIIAAATEHGADLVVVGSRGRTGLTRALLGSVARNVAHGSEASVLIVRSGTKA